MTVSLASGPVLVYLLATIRIVTWIIMVPPFSWRAVPMMAKISISLALALLVVPQMDPNIDQGNAAMIGAILNQVLIGGALGFVTMMLFQAISSAGSMIDQFGGFAMAQTFDPMSMNRNSVMGRFYQLLTVALMISSGAYLLVIGGLLKTFQILPVGAGLGGIASWGDVVATSFSVFIVTALEIALPLIAVLFVSDLGLALLTKAAPQMNALNFMFPVKIALTLLLVGATFPILVPAVERLTRLALQAMSQMVGGG